ncbi:MAG: DUF1684 domain-containing protein [Acidobacteria bacterium]|nr:DUF1684 domain-containing protein [Acidobacteriota bacterium]
MKRIAAIAVAAALLGGCAAPLDEGYRREVERWRAEREERLRAPDGWLTLTGLAWLAPGENTFGSAPDNAVVLADGPPHAGLFVLDGSRVVVRDERGDRELRPDTSGRPDVLEVGRLRLTVIERVGKYGIRVKDPESPVRTGFRGLSWYPVDAAWRIDAEFEPYDPPREIEIATQAQTVERMRVPGRVRFRAAGREVTLTPVTEEGDEGLFFIFRDATSGRETYGAGRFLGAEAPRGGRVTLDFNKAYNPPCVFTEYATCPLPPRENWLPVAVEAGEKTYAGSHGE